MTDCPRVVSDTAGGSTPASSLPGVILHRNGSLSVPAASAQHRGLYACRASNGVGPPLTARPQLTVYGETPPELSLSSEVRTEMPTGPSLQSEVEYKGVAIKL